MIESCIESMRLQSCGTCAHRDDCRFVLPEALGFLLSAKRPAPDPERGSFAARHPFLAFLGHVAKGIERNRAPRRDAPVRRMVEDRLEPLLAAGPMRSEAVARSLGFSRQTMYRRLKAEGTTFEQVLDALRRKLALRFIRDEDLAVKDAAYRLGFSDPAAFSRAFKRWTGASPSELRGKKPH